MNWLRRMMAGRYGVDQLSLVLLIPYFIFFFLSRIPQCWYLVFVALAILALIVFRTLSRNTNRRFLENQAFLRRWHAVKRWFAGLGTRSKERKTHRVYKCPDCGQKLRVPRGRGKIRITCPKCGKQFIKKT